MDIETEQPARTRKIGGKSLSQRVLDQLRRDIVTGALAPGTVIRDVELAKSYGVSTSPLREALTILEMEQLVQMPSDRVRQIAPISRKTTLEVAALITLLMDHAISTGIDHLDETALAQMKEFVSAARIAQANGDPHRALKMNRRFFDVIIRAGNNEALRRTIMLHASWIERIFTLAIPVEKSGWAEMANEMMIALEGGTKKDVMKVVKKRHVYFERLFDELPRY